MKLQELASITRGYYFRRKMENEDDGNFSVLRLRDISKENTIDISNLIKVKLQPENSKQKQLLEKGDILIRSIGFNNSAILIEEDFEKTIIGDHIFKIKTIENSILPEYLCWFLNNREIQSVLKNTKLESALPRLSIKIVNNLEIKIPPIEIQKKIIELNRLSKKDMSLQKQISEKRKLYLEEILIRLSKTGVK
jgi:restriction endonuclease S subunit